jgi:hypothetical protein
MEYRLEPEAAHVGFDYIHALTCAIESWSADAVSASPRSFTYRGANLRYAVERVLYFDLANDKWTQNQYIASINGSVAPATKAPSVFASLIFPYLVRQRNRAGPHEVNSGVGSQLSRVSWPRRLLRRVESKLSMPRIDLPAEYKFLFLVIHPKFVGFVAPLIHELGDSAAFLTIDSPETKALITERGHAAVHLRTVIHRLASDGALAHFSILCNQYDLIYKLLSEHPMSALILTEGNAPICEVAARAASNCKVPTVCVQYGWAPMTHSGFRNLSFDRMLMWGPMFAELLARYNPRQKFAFPGTPESIQPPIDLNPARPIRRIGFFLQKDAVVISKKNWQDFLRLIGWVANSLPVEVIVREHPSTPSLDDAERAIIGTHANIRIISASAQPLAETLAACDIAVSGYSTVLVEAIGAGVIPVIFGAAIPQYWPDLAGYGAGIEEIDLEVVEDKLRNICVDSELRSGLRNKGAELRPRLFSAVGVEAIDRIVAEIVSGAGSQASQSHDCPTAAPLVNI